MSDENSPSAPEPVPRAVRASDEDRDRLVDELNEHAVAGRLSTDELEERLEAAYGARTTGELETLRHDLPVSPHRAALAQAQRRAHLSRRMLQEAGGSLGAFVLCTVIWVVSGAHGQFWPVWVLVVVVLTFARSGWALFGPAPDLDAVEAQLDARRRTRAEHRDKHLNERDRRRAGRHRRPPDR